MTIHDYIYNVLETIKTKNSNISCWAHRESNTSKTNYWYQVVISDVDWYLKSEWLKQYSKKINKEFKEKFGYKIVFCATSPDEKYLLELSNEDNLLI